MVLLSCSNHCRSPAVSSLPVSSAVPAAAALPPPLAHLLWNPLSFPGLDLMLPPLSHITITSLPAGAEEGGGTALVTTLEVRALAFTHTAHDTHSQAI